MRKSIHSDKQKLLLDLLIKIRKDSGVTQVELAKALDRPQSFVSKYESGERRLDFLELYEVCRLLKFPMKKLIDEFEGNLK